MQLGYVMRSLIALAGLSMSLVPPARATVVTLTASCHSQRCSVQRAVLSNCSCGGFPNPGGFQSCVQNQDKSLSSVCRSELSSCEAATSCGSKAGVTCQVPPYGSNEDGQCTMTSNASSCASMGGVVAM